MKKIIRLRPRPEQGNALLYTVVILAIVIGFGSTFLVRTSFNTLINANRQQQARKARNAAEKGFSVTMEALNGTYNTLLANCYYENLADIQVDNSCSNAIIGVWDDENDRTPLSSCPGQAVAGYPDVEKTYTNDNSSYTIDYYAYSGSAQYGGTGTLQITGNSLSKDNQDIISSTTIRKTFDVEFSNCGGSSGFPGLYGADNCDIGGGKVLGSVSGNVVCPGNKDDVPSCLDSNGDVIPTCAPTESESLAAIGSNNQSVIGGEVYLNDLNLPRVPLFPENEAALNLGTNDGLEERIDPDNTLEDLNARSPFNDFTVTPVSITNSTTITTVPLEGALSLGNSDSDGDGIADDGTINPIDDFCVTLETTDNLLITHCKVNDITFSGKKVLTVDTTHSAVRFYVTGDVSVGGSSGIRQICDVTYGLCRNDAFGQPDPSRLAFFGLPRSTNPVVCDRDDPNFDPDTFLQTVFFAGVSKPQATAASLFAYFPCATGGINGGAQGDADCTDPNYQGECGGGDVVGAIWLKEWDGSNSTQAELVVPEDFLKNIGSELGQSFQVSVKAGNGFGVVDWTGFKGLSSQ